ncbi:MAG: DUF2974 domain-containing protein [Ruminococcaceae bacterium]|nr:DUF2974 domain-containing protein [Oscillospiraceae bacterium]
MDMDREKKTTLQDYLRWRGDLTFAQAPFNEVDNLLLCIISYMDLQKLPLAKSKRPGDALPLSVVCDMLTEEDQRTGLTLVEYLPVIREAAKTARFSQVGVFGYESSIDEEKEMQFAAMSFLIPDGSVFLAYRGTDATLVGWKEDFNMSFLEAVPAQRRAVEYACQIADACRWKKLRLGGHSKGGNLAAWAAIHLPERIRRRRLLKAYNNDGPGFSAALLKTERYQSIADRIETFVPESSIVGMLLEHEEDCIVIDSVNRALLQHEPMSWCVVRDQFVRLGQRSQLAQLSDGVIRGWLEEFSAEEREQFIETMFQILSMGGQVKTLDEVRKLGLSGGLAMLREYIGAGEKERKILNEIFRRLAVNLREELRAAAENSLKAKTESRSVEKS